MIEPVLPFETENVLDFYSEDVEFDLENATAVDAWLKSLIKEEGKELDSISYIFCSDPYLLEINQSYLNHSDYTDTISFTYNENPVEGDIFISIDRIKENAKDFNVEFYDELHRVFAHSTLHLLGYNDKSPGDKLLMTEKENYYLSKRSFLK